MKARFHQQGTPCPNTYLLSPGTMSREVLLLSQSQVGVEQGAGAAPGLALPTEATTTRAPRTAGVATVDLALRTCPLEAKEASSLAEARGHRFRVRPAPGSQRSLLWWM